MRASVSPASWVACHSKTRCVRHRVGSALDKGFRGGDAVEPAMTGAGESRVARRLAAQLELERAIHGLMIHELGNPLQSLLVLIELSRDELADAAVGDDLRTTPGAEWVARPAERLDRALTSIGRLREV